MVAIAPPPKYQRRPDRPRPPRASPAPSLPRSRSRSATPGGPPRCSHCDQPTLIPDEGGLVCQSCGIINEEDSNFRAEVEFDESSSGAIKTRGTHIGQNQTHSKQAYNSRIASAAHVGHEATKALDRAKADAQQRFKHFALNLHVRETEEHRAMYLFEKAYERAFYRGRTLESVAIVCLYLAVRQCTARERYPLMLIDFAEISQGSYNVFELGKMVKILQQKLYLDANRDIWFSLERQKEGASKEKQAELTAEQIERQKGGMNLQDPEDLIERFCDKLDFGDLTNIVKRDAAKVAKSMNRDWMVTGRRPSGIAGAAVIIAARMNNFRRTLREVVLVAKVTEITLSKRIEEFRETSSSTMSVKDFRATDPTSVEGYEITKPPSYYRALPEWQEKQANKKKKKRKRKNGKLPESAAAIENDEDEQTETEVEDEEEEADGAGEEEQPQAKRPRLDAEGFAIPELPTRPSTAATTETSQRRKAGKPKGAKNWKPRPPTEAEQEEERELEVDIADQLQRNASLDPTGTIAQDEMPSEPPAPGTGVTDIYPKPRNNDSLGPSVESTVGNLGNTPMDEILGSDEFADDPDVANCVLSEQEKRIKETIWVTENADWLRTEHAKKIKRELKDRELREKGIDPEKERMKKIRRKDGMQRAGRAGDISYLEEARNKRREQDGADAEGAENAEGANDAEEERQQAREVSVSARGSVKVMMQQRGTFSRRVDYDKLSQAYVLPGFEESSESRSESPADPNRFFKPHTSRNHEASNKRRARATLDRIAGTMSTYETDGETDIDRNSPRARSRSGSVAQAASANNEDDEEEDAEHEEDTGTPEASGTTVPASSARQLPTPAATQSQPRAASIPPRQPSEQPRASPVLIEDNTQGRSESPLSSTHTPAGYGSGAPGTPLPTQLAAQPTQQTGTREDPEEVESEGDDDDYVEDDDEPDDDPDKYFGAGEEVVALGEEEEVVDDDF
ncbi:transcription factor TFIIIB subunit brf1 [Knufia obscura]|uniref:Transcription factor TFIIIB subunit brf1 n=2 Tax=Knufia TaxID=430999 RepID=A0AAN8EUU8_9EURO|nr:transcription factor TFIIIB subunit brf1 [Knufia obscura]KAK5954241.1 transcription factor TFIIIB subunit brf1 [Knufia fluminis]